ncbi:MAG: dTDP-4-dehydrorhamnose 3,5-epimerase [Solirubrobacterales bacterium]|nr:dTDP-4-dehydrorhamnose 3,5-epimerase [Solirubrobacterales bacterium]
MQQIPTRLDGPVLIEPKVFGDDRGFFAETFRANTMAEQFGITEHFIQDNHSRSARGVVRGMHFQIGEGASKLVRCGRGAILDVAVDLRRGSPTYGAWEGVELSEENMRVFYVPVGFAHGFCVLSEVADVFYKQSNYYSTEVERGFSLRDPEVAVEWPFPEEELSWSERDLEAPTLAEIADGLPFEYVG